MKKPVCEYFEIENHSGLIIFAVLFEFGATRTREIPRLSFFT